MTNVTIGTGDLRSFQVRWCDSRLATTKGTRESSNPAMDDLNLSLFSAWFFAPDDSKKGYLRS